MTKLYSIFECDFLSNTEMNTFEYDDSNHIQKFNVRDGYYSGYNDMFYRHYLTENSKLICLDIHSCYPGEQWFEEYPYGEYEEFDYIHCIGLHWADNLFGLA